jgi:hypothetical protein
LRAETLVACCFADAKSSAAESCIDSKLSAQIGLPGIVIRQLILERIPNVSLDPVES